MIGIIFTEFVDMVEDKFSLAVLDKIIERAAPESGGAYTTVGNYSDPEMVSLVATLSEETGIAVPDLLKAYGEHLLGRFTVVYPWFFEGKTSAIEFLGTVEDHVHAETRKLYPEAVTPVIDCQAVDADNCVIHYRSPRGLADVAEGLLIGCMKHFGETFMIEREDLSGGQSTEVRFTLSRQH